MKRDKLKLPNTETCSWNTTRLGTPPSSSPKGAARFTLLHWHLAVYSTFGSNICTVSTVLNNVGESMIDQYMSDIF